ncbi:MAG: hypothetical protein LUG16_05520 [Candidatus Gastranaerophilales bacterium]|nr:hypothetical protein [Candidatus Gastranaerophilales bacterium]
MGLSSSQGRLLLLTARLSDLEYSEIMVSQRQNVLAMNQEEVASDYSEAMNNYKLTIKVTDSDTQETSKQDVSYSNLTSSGYLVINSNNEIYLTKDEDGNWIIPTDVDGNELLSIDADTGKAIINDEEYNVRDGSSYLDNSSLLQDAIINGRLFLLDTNQTSSSNTYSISDLSSNTSIEYVLDTSDDEAAESEYEYETARLSRQENQLDLELQQLETQHEAVMNEYDSVKELISNNIERTFKLFTSG